MITPTQAKEKAAPSTADLKRLEKIIDEALVFNMRSGSSYATIQADIFPNRIARETLMSKYSLAGWEVTYTSDQRDGDFLTFKERNYQPREYYDR